jgi:hypothetical protein
MAVLLRGGMLPHAYVYPAAMRATRDLLRRRRPLMRNRAALLTPGQPTTGPYTLPDIGKTLAYQTNRAGVAARCAAPAVPTSREGDLALIDYDDQRLRALAWAIVTMAQQHDGHTLYVLQTGPGLGQILRRVRLYERHDSARFPRGQDLVSSGRGVKCAKDSAGKR